MQKIKIALFSSSKKAYSETFIQNHRRLLDGNVIFYTNGKIPKENDIEGELVDTNSFRYKLLRLQNKTYKEILQEAIIRSLKRNKINVCYIEYGTMAIKLLPILKKANIPFIVNFHGYDISMYKVVEDNLYLYKKLFDYANIIVGVSKLMCKTFEKLGCPENKIFYNPCSPQMKFVNLKPQFKKKQIISIGRFVDKKAPYVVLMAFREIQKNFKDASLIMIGDGRLKNVIYSLLKIYDIKNVKLLGAVEHDEVMRYLEESYLFIQHSITALDGDMEGTPVSVMEASLSGLPVVSTYHAGIPDVVINGETGILVNELDLQATVEAMSELLKNRDSAIEMGRRGRKFILSNYSEKIHKERLNESVRKALEQI